MRARAVRAVVALGALVLPSPACTIGEGRPGMASSREQPRADPYEASEVFADGRVMQRPPEGTVPRGTGGGEPTAALTGVLANAPGSDTATSATSALPVAVTPALLAEGEAGYRAFCAPCHGAAGFGGGVVAMSMSRDVPPSLRADSTRALPAAEVYRIVTEGGDRMPSYAAQLTPDERWAVVAYVQRLQARPPRTLLERQDSARAAAMVARRGGGRTPSGGAAAGPAPSVPGLDAPARDTAGARPLDDTLGTPPPIRRGERRVPPPGGRR